MEIVISTAALAVALISLFVSFHTYRQTLSAARPQPEEAVDGETVDPADRARERLMDQGVENILSYSVRLGRGKTTGGEA